MTIERVAPSVVRARVGKATVSLSVVTGHIMASAPGGATAATVTADRTLRQQRADGVLE